MRKASRVIAPAVESSYEVEGVVDDECGVWIIEQSS